MTPQPAPAPEPQLGKFVTGSTMRHVLTMTATGSIGLMAVFIVDLLNLFYISRLGQQALAAAVGYASTLLFFITSLCIGLSIAATALTSRPLGKGDRAQAVQLAGASLVIMGAMTLLVTLLTWPFLHPLLELLGARGETADLATGFLRIVLPSSPLLALGMGLVGLLRATGDAKRSMYVTLAAGLAVAVLDPLFIFGFGWGLHGAAWATALARIVMLAIGFNALIRIHHLFAWPSSAVLRQTLTPFIAIGLPAVLTQIATPVGNAVVTAAMARFGDDAVAGWAVIGRIIPVAFVVLFALSGSVGAVLGQNYGAKRFDRVRSAIVDSFKLTLYWVLGAWAVLALFSGPIANAFGASGQAHDLIVFFCLFVSASFIFNGALFVANAAFNNLGYAFYSTALNWGRATIGVAPAWLAAPYFGAKGVLAGYGLGVVGFGVVGVWLCFRVLTKLEESSMHVASRSAQ